MFAPDLHIIWCINNVYSETLGTNFAFWEEIALFLQFLWFALVGLSVLYGCLNGHIGDLLPAALSGTGNAISVTLNLAAGYLFFCGLMEIVKALGLPKTLSRWLKPGLKLLMPKLKDDEALCAVTMNLSANMLGLGNAATPYGIAAANRLDVLSESASHSRQALYMLLILNATSIQLLPTTVLTLRIAAGSTNPNLILMPSLVSSAVSTVVGVLLGLLLAKRTEAHHGV